MKQNPLKISLIGGGITFLCFFLPWIKLDFSSLSAGIALSSQKTGYMFGIQRAINGTTFDVLNFLAVLAILGVCLYMVKQQTAWKARIPVLICSSFGVIYFLIILISSVIINNLMASKLMEMQQTTEMYMENMISVQFGLYGAVVGVVVAHIGAWNIPKSDTSIKESEEME